MSGGNREDNNSGKAGVAGSSGILVRYDTGHEGDFLLVIASGEYTLDGVMAAFRAAVDECVRRKHQGMIIDVREVRGRISVMDRFDFGESMARPLLKLNLRLGFLCRPDQVTAEGFLQSVMVNRGARVRVDTDIARIRGWLSEVPPAA